MERKLKISSINIIYTKLPIIIKGPKGISFFIFIFPLINFGATNNRAMIEERKIIINTD
jgi:hypothetical protein